mgnify:FL=1
MFSKQNLVYFAMALIIIWAFAYMAYGADTPTREEMKANRIEQLQEDNARIETHNKMVESVCETESLEKWSAIEIARYKLSCLEKDTKKLIDIDSEIAKEFGTGSVVVWTVTDASSSVAKHTTQILAEDRSLSIECELWVRDRKVEWIEFHYTDTVGSTLAAIKRWHEGKFGIDHIGYHYVIKENGEITSTRDERCIAAADKWSSNNHRLIQIAFIGNDKPTKEQTKSMVELTRDIQKRYSLPIDSISAHREWWPKSDKESLTYWYGSKDKFIKMVEWKETTTDSKVLLRNGEQLESVNYAWNKWKDMDFILTIDQESRWNPDAIWDVNHPKVGDYAYGYCQYNSNWHKDKIAYYKSLPTWKEKIDWCHERYIEAMDRPGWIGGTFHGYNARLKNKSKYSFQ